MAKDPNIYETLINLVLKMREDPPKKTEEKVVSASEPSKTFTPGKIGGESRKAREENPDPSSGGSTKRLVEEVLEISKKPNGNRNR